MKSVKASLWTMLVKRYKRKEDGKGKLEKGRNVSKDVKRGLRNSILLPTLTYGSENWTWNGAQQSRVRAVEMSYFR